MNEDMALNDSVSGVSRSGRVRKKSAKLMEMEDYHSPLFEIESSETAKSRKKPPRLGSPPIPLSASHHSPPFLVPEVKTPASSVAAKVKSSFITPTSVAQPSNVVSRAPMVTPPSVPKGRERVIAIKQLEPPAQSFEALSGSAYLMGDDIHFITGEPVGPAGDSLDDLGPESRLSQLKIDIGSPSDHHNVSVHEESGLKMKFILSPKVTGAKPEAVAAGKRKGVTARRNPSDLISRPPVKKPMKGNARASPKSPAKRKSVTPARKQPQPTSISALDVFAAGGIPSFEQDSSADEDDVLGNSKLIIAEPSASASVGGKKFRYPDKTMAGRPIEKSRLKQSNLKLSPHERNLSSEMASPSMDTSMQQQSLYLKEKISAKKKSGKKMIKLKEGKSEKKPRPVSAYMLYCKEYRIRLLRDDPSLDFAALSRKLGEMWKSMSDSDKMHWRRKAKSVPTKLAFVKSGGKMLDSRKHKGSVSSSRHPQWANTRQDESLSPAKEAHRAASTAPLDVAAYLKLLGESLSIIGQRLTEHEGQIAVSGSLSVLLDSTLCALGPLICLTSEVQEMDGCPKLTQETILDNIAYIMPGL